MNLTDCILFPFRISIIHFNKRIVLLNEGANVFRNVMELKFIQITHDILSEHFHEL